MTQEQKQLLLVDLSARLPYGVKVLTYKLDYFHNPPSIETLYEINEDGYISTVESDILRPIGKPYLFPLSSMTIEQRQELDVIVGKKIYREINYHECIRQMIDFYHKNHFDYRGLTEKGLAIDCTNLNIY